MEFITLNNGVKMPLEGFGVFQVPDAAICEQAVTEAIAAGYRLIDTAAAYYNDEAVGAAIAKSTVPREKLFITTKLWVQDASYEAAQKAIDTSLQKLGLNYLDLYLIHQPMGGMQGQVTDIKIHAERYLRIKENLNKMLADNTGKPLEIIQRDTERDNFMSAQEAMEYGLIDKVITNR